MVAINAFRFRTIRRRVVWGALVLGGMVLVAGCGDSGGVREATMPPAEFSEKLEREHPELFLEKIGRGKKTAPVGGRARRAIIREQYAKWLHREGQ